MSMITEDVVNKHEFIGDITANDGKIVIFGFYLIKIWIANCDFLTDIRTLLGH